MGDNIFADQGEPNQEKIVDMLDMPYEDDFEEDDDEMQDDNQLDKQAMDAIKEPEIKRDTILNEMINHRRQSSMDDSDSPSRPGQIENQQEFNFDEDQKENTDDLKRKFDDFFSSESEDIEQNLIDNEDSLSENSDNSADQLSPRSIEQAL